jgi:hypothetical protein
MTVNKQANADLGLITIVKRTNILSLFTSASTLICCALPAILVAIGSAAVLTSLFTHFHNLSG